MKGEGTYSLDIAFKNCRDEAEQDLIRRALHNAISAYQWQYQTASNQAYREAYNNAKRSILTVVQLLKNQGQNVLASDVLDALTPEDLTTKKIISNVKPFLKKHTVKAKGSTITSGRYNKLFALFLIEAFKEWCNKNPLDEAPLHLDNSF